MKYLGSLSILEICWGEGRRIKVLLPLVVEVEKTVIFNAFQH